MKVKYRRSIDITMIKIMAKKKKKITAKVTQRGVLSALDRGCGGVPRSPFTEGAWPGPGGAGGGSQLSAPSGMAPATRRRLAGDPQPERTKVGARPSHPNSGQL